MIEIGTPISSDHLPFNLIPRFINSPSTAANDFLIQEVSKHTDRALFIQLLFSSLSNDDIQTFPINTIENIALHITPNSFNRLPKLRLLQD